MSKNYNYKIAYFTNLRIGDHFLLAFDNNEDDIVLEYAKLNDIRIDDKIYNARNVNTNDLRYFKQYETIIEIFEI